MTSPLCKGYIPCHIILIDRRLLFEPGFETKLLLRRINGEIRVRSNVEPTFDSLVGFGRSGGTTTAPLFSRIHTSLINVYSNRSNWMSNSGLSLLKKQ
ncbi:hypothetical protein R3W88_009678 [Solanum pinnatisectum]|uniref:Uncharacterized protein ycf68 n=1 Tax=Solanum pinnatisectum TaxID=50273 RepID=A0AAV9MFE8_9SOLN|nr:hypothetical protein R3W88_009678 [Solanum pinnatisectum]